MKDAISRCLALGLVPEIEGSGYVHSQSPATGNGIKGQVTLFCNGTKVAKLERYEAEETISID